MVAHNKNKPMFKFGEVYFSYLPLADDKPGTKDHYCILVSETEKTYFFYTISSRIYKVFSEFVDFLNGCMPNSSCTNIESKFLKETSERRISGKMVFNSQKVSETLFLDKELYDFLDYNSMVFLNQSPIPLSKDTMKERLAGNNMKLKGKLLVKDKEFLKLIVQDSPNIGPVYLEEMLKFFSK